MGNARVRPLHKQIESVVAKAPLQIILIEPPLQSTFATEWSCLAVTPIASLWRNDATEAFVVTGNDTLDLSELEDILGRLGPKRVAEAEVADEILERPTPVEPEPKQSWQTSTHPAFIIEKTKDGQFRFNLTAKNGQVILSSESYTTKDGCKNGIESVKKNASDDSRFDRNTAKNGDPYFNLKAGNNQVIGTSEMYSSKGAMENGIGSVKVNSQIAEINDKTV